jgi:hypothetical protein
MIIINLKLNDYYLISFCRNLRVPWFGFFKTGLKVNYSALPFRLHKTLPIFSPIMKNRR